MKNKENGYSAWWWHWINENVKHQPGRGSDAIKGSILKHGRAFFYRFGWQFFKIEWYWKPRLEATLEITLDCDDDPGVQVHVTLFGLPALFVTFGATRAFVQRWFTPWMISDRSFGVRLGYIGDIAWLTFAYAQWAEDCGMTSYYRAEKPRRYTDRQLWPGWEIKLRWPPVLRWVLGNVVYKSVTLRQKEVSFDMDGRTYHALLSWEKLTWQRLRLPWPHRTMYLTDIKLNAPPLFAGKGENSWDCDDDGIFGMSSKETSEAGAIGDYIKAVLKNRERYGKARESERV